MGIFAQGVSFLAWLFSSPPLLCHRPPPQPSPAAAREGESIFGTVYEISLPCRSGGGLGWGPVAEERRGTQPRLKSNIQYPISKYDTSVYSLFVLDNTPTLAYHLYGWSRIKQ